jgi:hypothetical protein
MKTAHSRQFPAITAYYRQTEKFAQITRRLYEISNLKSEIALPPALWSLLIGTSLELESLELGTFVHASRPTILTV